nr:flagellar basal body-associated FliL family protein [Nocardioides perillae]
MSTAENKVKPLEAEVRSSRKRLVVSVVLVLTVVVAAGWILWRPAAGGEAKPELGEVVALEPVQLNLSGGRFLRIGIALQLAEGAEEVEGSRALDALISAASGRQLAEINSPDGREALQSEIRRDVLERYEEAVLDVYLTEFVTQ